MKFLVLSRKTHTHTFSSSSRPNLEPAVTIPEPAMTAPGLQWQLHGLPCWWSCPELQAFFHTPWCINWGLLQVFVTYLSELAHSSGQGQPQTVVNSAGAWLVFLLPLRHASFLQPDSSPWWWRGLGLAWNPSSSVVRLSLPWTPSPGLTEDQAPSLPLCCCSHRKPHISREVSVIPLSLGSNSYEPCSGAHAYHPKVAPSPATRSMSFVSFTELTQFQGFWGTHFLIRGLIEVTIDS
jgi:hypothetical protein